MTVGTGRNPVRGGIAEPPAAGIIRRRRQRISMEYNVSFGRLGRTSRPAVAGQKFRLALLGDFSGAANAGRLATGEALARRKPVKVDVDNLDDVLARHAAVAQRCRSPTMAARSP